MCLQKKVIFFFRKYSILTIVQLGIEVLKNKSIFIVESTLHSLNSVVNTPALFRPKDASWEPNEGSTINDVSDNKNLEESSYVILQSKGHSMFPARVSPVVPWIRIKNNFRRKKRGNWVDSRLGTFEKSSKHQETSSRG